MRLEVSPIAINELCEDALALMSEQAEARKIKIRYTMQPHLPYLMADELRVRQMLLNLLANAVKFSKEETEIGLDVTMQATEVHMTVWDNGIGIPEDKQHLLFKPFQQIDGSLSRCHEGTGLGLALTRRLAELHSGTVEVKSSEGQGSHFTIRLPFDANLSNDVGGYDM